MKKIAIVCAMITMLACKESKDKTVYTDSEIAANSQQLNDWFQEQWDADIARSPMFQTQMGIKTDDYGKWDDISPANEEKELAIAKERHAFLTDSIDFDGLDTQTQLSHRLYLYGLNNDISGYQYRNYDYPVNQMHGAQAEIPAFLINMHQINSVSDAEAYLSRLQGLKPMMEQLSENLRLRESEGIMPPKFVFDHVIKDARNILKGAPFDATDVNPLTNDFETKIDALDIPEVQKKELRKQFVYAMTTGVQPGYETLIATLEDQQAKATDEDGVWKFPNGAAFYNAALKFTTTTDMTSDEIHALGLSEVDRIHTEMTAIKDKVGFEGSLQDFFAFMRSDPQFYYPDTAAGRARYMEEATAIIDSMRLDLDDLFLTKPKAEIIVKAVEPFREASAGKAFYQQPAVDGSRPGTYYANMYKMEAMPTYQMEALAFHEGIPGHHMQIAISQELQGIPEFRKFSFQTAYVEGWGLYSEFIPKEIGYYSDPYAEFGRLAMELWRACRLVVDTGIHSKRWTRQQGIDYYVDNTPNATSDAVKMVERHIVMPSQATAYKVGMNKILELREKAKTAMGAAFDIREFHDVILINGSLPLAILEELVDEYIAGK